MTDESESALIKMMLMEIAREALTFAQEQDPQFLTLDDVQEDIFLSGAIAGATRVLHMLDDIADEPL